MWVCVCIGYALCDRFFVFCDVLNDRMILHVVIGMFFSSARFILSVSVSHITSRVFVGAFVIFWSGSVSNSALKQFQFAWSIENLGLLGSSIGFVFILMCMGMWSDACVLFSSLIWWVKNKNYVLANNISGLPLLVPKKCLEFCP